MSIKRTKQSSYNSRNRDYPSDGPMMGAKPSEPDKSWADHMAGKAEDAFVPYSLAQRFDKGALVSHAKFGKGIVVNVEGSRIEVLFEEGTKKLGHGGG
jgi:hypothetical protein